MRTIRHSYCRSGNITQKKETRRKERNERKEEKRKKNPPVGKRNDPGVRAYRTHSNLPDRSIRLLQMQRAKAFFIFAQTIYINQTYSRNTLY